MITLNGIQLPFPSEYRPDYIISKGNHSIMNKGIKRYSKNAKYSIQLGWNYLSKEEINTILELYNSQFTEFEPLVFKFDEAMFGEDIGPIEVFINLEERTFRINKAQGLTLTLTEV